MQFYYSDYTDLSMKRDISQNEIEKLESILYIFKDEWQIKQSQKAFKWRAYFLASITISVIVSLLFPTLGWLNIIVIGYFAGSLYSMLRLNTKTINQIIEHQKQLKLVRFLNNLQGARE